MFDAPWQAEALALAVTLSEGGAFAWPEFSAALAARVAAGDGPYWDQWLEALESLLTAKGLAAAGALAELKEAWAEAYRRTPHGEPVTPPAILAGPAR